MANQVPLLGGVLRVLLAGVLAAAMPAHQVHSPRLEAAAVRARNVVEQTPKPARQ